MATADTPVDEATLDEDAFIEPNEQIERSPTPPTPSAFTSAHDAEATLDDSVGSAVFGGSPDELHDTIMDDSADDDLRQELLRNGGAAVDQAAFEAPEPLTQLDAAAMIGVAPLISSKQEAVQDDTPSPEPPSPAPEAVAPSLPVPQLEALEPAPPPRDVVGAQLQAHEGEIGAAAGLLAKLIPVVVATTLVIAIAMGLLPFLRRMLSRPEAKRTTMVNVRPGDQRDEQSGEGVFELLRRQERKVTPIEEARRKNAEQP